MKSRSIRFLMTASCLALPIAALAGMEIGGDPQPVTDTYNLGYQDGYAAGVPAGREQCRQNPNSCSIYPSNVLPDAQYGETETNDSIYNADYLPEAVNFWGQSYSTSDQDWFYIYAGEANTNLNITFTLPEASTTGCPTVITDEGQVEFDCTACQTVTDPATGEDTLLCSLTGWTLSIRNAAGIVIAEFDTGFTSVDHAKTGINYRVTLGLAGTYYVQIKPNDQRFSYQMYNLTTMLEKSPYNEPQQNVGYADVEIEPNNTPAQANLVYNTVSMYGMINLQFENAVCNDETCEYLQNEPDWFKYSSPGSEILQIAFCDRTKCSEGAWLMQVYDQNGATAIAAGESASPLMAFNVEASGDPTSAADGTPGVWQLGLNQGGDYFLQVGLKKKIEASCAQWGQDQNNDGIADTSPGTCACGDGAPRCEIDIPNPNGSEPGEDGEEVWNNCPDGSEGSSQCTVGCVCTGERGIVELPEGDVSAQYNFTLSTSLQGPRPQATLQGPRPQ